VFPVLPRATLVVACLVLAGMGMLPNVSAINEDCKSPPREEDFQHPLKKEYYLYIPEGDHDRAKFGWWKDINGREGIQTEGCSVGDKIIYVADQQTDRLLP
jgi:hypothetical protein